MVQGPVARVSLKITWRDLLAIGVVAVAYIALAQLGFSLASATRQVTAVWAPTGIAVAALLMYGYRLWPGIYLGAFMSNAMSQEPLLTAALIAIGNTLAPICGVYLMRRFEGFNNALERVRDVLVLVVLGSGVAMTISATNGVLNLVAAAIVPWASFGPVWFVWWVGDAMGVLLVAPVLITWAAASQKSDPERYNAFEVAAFAVLTLATAWVSFMSNLPLGYPIYPFVIWSALRFRQRDTALAVVIICAIALWGTTHNLGPFRAGSLDERFMLLTTFMAVLSVTGLVLGAVRAERRVARFQLRAAERRFHVLAEAVPEIVWTADATGWIDWANHRWYEYTGQTNEEGAGWGWQSAHHPEDLQRIMQEWPHSIATGKPFQMEYRIRGNDGVFRWFLTRAEPLRDESGAIVRWYGSNTNINEQKRAHEQTTRVAETLQAAFLPEHLPAHPEFRFDAIYLTAEQQALIGGDWYDAFEVPSGHFVISIGDVVGHGLGAAVMAGRIRQGIFATALDVLDPATILNKVNRMLQFQGSPVVTAMVAIIDAELTFMRYASAGHPPPIIAGPSIPAQSLHYGGMPLGVADALDIQTRSVRLERDAVILFYTDGITEFKRDIAGTEILLMQAVTALVGDTSVAHPALAIRQAVMGEEKPTDDTALMVLQLSPILSDDPANFENELRRVWTFHSSDAYSAHVSRHELTKFMRPFVSSDEELFRAELILGEVLANTVEHAPGLVRLELDWTGAHPVVTVADTGPGLSRFVTALPEDALTEDGRGLFLITNLAIDVRVESSAEGGTTMRIVLPVTREMSAPLGA